jgi:hypothetical protein
VLRHPLAGMQRRADFSVPPSACDGALVRLGHAWCLRLVCDVPCALLVRCCSLGLAITVPLAVAVYDLIVGICCLAVHPDCAVIAWAAFGAFRMAAVHGGRSPHQKDCLLRVQVFNQLPVSNKVSFVSAVGLVGFLFSMVGDCTRFS